MKGMLPPLITRPANRAPKGVEMPDPNTETVPPYLTRDELKRFKALRAAGKILQFNVKSCACGVEIPTARSSCSVKCFKEHANDAR